MPKILFISEYDVLVVKVLCETLDDNTEGFVMRITDRIMVRDWSRCAAKWVRPNHVQTDKHWMHQKITKNKLKG